MEVILKSIRKDKAEKRRKLMELERLINTGGDKNEIEKLRWEVSGKRDDTFEQELFKDRSEEDIAEEKKIAAQAIKLNPTRTRVRKHVGLWDVWKEKAEANGVDYEQFMQRVRRDWTCEQAAGQKIRPGRKSLWEDWEEVCESNGITYRLFMQRVNKGWDYETASSKFVKSKNLVDWEKWKVLAEQYGVGYPTFYNRCKKGWSQKEAATTIPKDNGRKGKKMGVNL